MARLNECILYRDFEHGDLLAKMAEIMTLWEKDAAMQFDHYDEIPKNIAEKIIGKK